MGGSNQRGQVFRALPPSGGSRWRWGRRYARIWVYLKSSGNAGSFGYYRVGEKSVDEIEPIEIYPGDGGTALGNAIYGATFKQSPIPYTIQRSATDERGKVTWRTSGKFRIREGSTGTVRRVVPVSSGDNPLVTSDYDGDGKADPAVFSGTSSKGRGSIAASRISAILVCPVQKKLPPSTRRGAPEEESRGLQARGNSKWFACLLAAIRNRR